MNGLIPCLVSLGALAIIWGFLALIRYINYKGTLARAERGITVPESKAHRGLLRWGMLIAGLGLALSLGLYSIGFYRGDDYPLHLGPWMLGGFVILFLGIGLILFHFLTQKD